VARLEILKATVMAGSMIWIDLRTGPVGFVDGAEMVHTAHRPPPPHERIPDIWS
jgi:hypothetical protein